MGHFHAPCWAKRIENRDWKPPPFIIGKQLVIHAGKTFDKSAVDMVLDNTAVFGQPRVLPAAATDEGLIGVATVIGLVKTEEEAALVAGQGQERWFVGTYGWVLNAVRPFPEPIPCKGAQGLWSLPTWAEVRVRDFLKRSA